MIKRKTPAKKIENERAKMNEHQRNDKDIADLIGDIKKSYHKTNIIDVPLASLSNCDLAKRIGYMLLKSTNLSNKDFSMNFDPIEMQILKKIVSEETVQKRIVMKAEDYFKGIVFIDYFTNVITQNHSFIDELYDISKEFERINPLLDPDMDTVAKYAGISYISSISKDYILSRSNSESAERRFQRNNNYFIDDYVAVRKLDPFYESLGQKIFSMLNDPEVISNAAGFRSINELRAVIFIDCLMPYMENKESKAEVLSMMRSRQYFNASMKAMSLFSKEASLKSMGEYMKTVEEKSRELDIGSI